MPLHVFPLMLWVFLPVQVLTITDLPGQNILFAQIVHPGATFKTVYTHSLELTPVWEYFEISADDMIILAETVYESSGAGLPIADGEQVVTLKDGRFHLTGLYRRLPMIVMRITPQAHNTIWLNEAQLVDLSALVGHSVVRIEVKRRPYIVVIGMECQNSFWQSRVAALLSGFAGQRN